MNLDEAADKAYCRCLAEWTLHEPHEFQWAGGPSAPRQQCKTTAMCSELSRRMWSHVVAVIAEQTPSAWLQTTGILDWEVADTDDCDTLGEAVLATVQFHVWRLIYPLDRPDPGPTHPYLSEPV